MTTTKPKAWLKDKENLDFVKKIIDTMPEGAPRNLITAVHKFRLQQFHEGTSDDVKAYHAFLRHIVKTRYTTEDVIDANKLMTDNGLPPIQGQTPDVLRVFYQCYTKDGTCVGRFSNKSYRKKDWVECKHRFLAIMTLTRALNRANPQYDHVVEGFYDFWEDCMIPLSNKKD